MAWQRHIPALESAAIGINQAAEAWDAVSDSLCDQDGYPLDEDEYADGEVTRNATAWSHVETFLVHGPEVLAGVRAAAHGRDYVEGPIVEDLQRLRGLDTTLTRAARLQHEWDQVIALMDASLPGSRALYEGRAREIRADEGWYFAERLSSQGPALVRAADHLASRSDTDQPAQTDRVNVALARSTSDSLRTPPASPSAPPRPAPTPAHRSR
ncbi:hypothetical protein ACFV97_25535 [Streptomyces sp. NPDC059913]|uniref:hypothetical protein n=1 Tax=unclassified Streptomyces TaxID=2593676 RepID=UPI00365093D2